MKFTSREDLSREIESIDGFLRKEEAFLLYRIASRLPRGAVAAEIGSWMGRSSVAIALGLQEQQGRLHTIDDHRGITGHEGEVDADAIRATFLRNIERKGVSGSIEHHPHSSDALAKDWRINLDFLFIDGDHRYAAVQRDIANYTPSVKPGGWIAFHDTGGPEVARAIQEWAAQKRIRIAALCRAGTIFALQLPTPSSKGYSNVITDVVWETFDWAAREIPPRTQPVRKVITKLKKSFARRLLRYLSPAELR